MSGVTLGGAVLILLGVLGFAVPYFTTQQTREVARVGDLKLQATETTGYTIPPLVSGAAVGLGVLLLGFGLTQKR